MKIEYYKYHECPDCGEITRCPSLIARCNFSASTLCKDCLDKGDHILVDTVDGKMALNAYLSYEKGKVDKEGRGYYIQKSL